MEETSEQRINSKVPPQLLPHVYKKGQSGNPGGRPKGKSLKDYAREKLLAMTDEEREEFLNGIPKKDIWELAEGKPKQDVEAEVKGGLTINLVKYDDITNPTQVSSEEVSVDPTESAG